MCRCIHIRAGSCFSNGVLTAASFAGANLMLHIGVSLTTSTRWFMQVVSDDDDYGLDDISEDDGGYGL